MPDLKQALKDFVATSNSGKYADEKVLISKFPELKDYDIQALKDFVATSNSGKYKSEDELLSKFPEFNIKTNATPPPPPPTGPQPETPQPRNKVAEMLNQPKAVDRLKQVVPTSEVTSGTKKPIMQKEQEVQQIEQEVAKTKQRDEYLEGEKNRDVWGKVNQKAVEQNIGVKELFKRESDNLAQFLTDDNKVEFDYYKQIDDASRKVNELNQLVSDTRNPLAQADLQKAKFDRFKAQQQLLKYEKERVSSIDKKIAANDITIKTSYQYDPSYLENKPDFIKELEEENNKLREQRETPNYLKNPDEQVKQIYSQVGSEIDTFKVPGSTPREKIQNYALILKQQLDDLDSQIAKKENKAYGLTKISPFLDPSGLNLAGLNPDLSELRDKRMKLIPKLQIVAPIALINKIPTKENDWFGSAFARAVQKELLNPISTEGDIADMSPNEVSELIYNNNIATNLSENDLTQSAISKSKELGAPVKSYSGNWWANMAGTSVSMIPAFALGSGAVQGASTLAKIPSVLNMTRRLYKVSNIARTMQLGKYVVPTLKSAGKGIEYMAAEPFLNQEDLKDEASFLSGFLGQAISGPIGRALSGKNVGNLISFLFKEKAPIAAKMITDLGNRVAGGVGEYGDEVGNTLGPLLETYIETGDFQNLKKDLSENFGTLDANLELFVGSVVMGMAMGGGSGIGKASMENSKKIYNQLPPEQQKKADAIANALKKDVEKAEVQAKKEEIQEGAEPLAEDILTEEDKQKKQEAIEKLNNPASTVAEKVEAGTVLHNIQIKEHNANITEKALEEVAGEEVVSEEAVVETPTEEVAVEETKPFDPNEEAPIDETDIKRRRDSDKKRVTLDLKGSVNEADSYFVYVTDNDNKLVTLNGETKDEVISKVDEFYDEQLNNLKQTPTTQPQAKEEIIETPPSEVVSEEVITPKEEVGEVGVEADVTKSDADIEKRMSELEETGLKLDTPELKEYNALEKEMEKRERDTVFNTPLENVGAAVDALIQKEKDKPNGFGAFIEKRDARETKEVAERYLSADKLTDAELKEDFKDALFGNPITWYADGLKLRESMKEASNRGIVIDDLLKTVEKEFTKDGFDEATARKVIAGMLKPIFEGSQKVNENQISQQVESPNEQSTPSKEQAKEVVSEEVKQETPKKEVVKEQPKKAPAKKKPLTKQEKETIVKDRLLDRLSAYNKLSAYQQKTKGPSAEIVDIIGTASKYGFTIKDANVLKPNRTKKYELFKDGKRVGKSQTKSDIPEATPEQVKVAEKLIDKDLVTAWSGDTSTPRLDANTYGISWSEIRQGEKDIKAGKLNSTPAKKLIQVLNQIENSGEVNMVVGSGGAAMKVGYRLSEARQAMKEIPELTDSDMEEINANLDTLAKEYDEWFATLTEQEQNNILEENESRNQSEISENAEVGQGETNVSNEKEGTEGKGIKEQVKSVYKSIPELSNIGTVEQYSDYVNSIFPDSKVKNVVYHKTSAKEIEGGKFKTSRLGGVYFSFFNVPSGGLLKGIIQRVINENTIIAIVDVKNPFIVNRKNAKEVLKKTGLTTQDVTKLRKNFDLSNNDAVLGFPNERNDTGQLDNFPNISLNENDRKDIIELAVFDPNQIHILGSKDDIDGFKKFVSKKAKPSKKEIQELSSIGVTNFNLPNLVEEVKQMSKPEFVATKGSEFESKEQAESYWEDTRNGIFNKEVSDLKNTIDIEVRKSRNDLGSFKVGSGKMWTAMGKLMGLYVKKGVTSFGDFIQATGYKATSAMKGLWDSIRGRKSTIKLSTKNANIRNINARLFYTEALDGIPSTDDAQVILDALKDTIDVYKTMSIHAAKNDVQDINNATDALTDLYVELSSDLETVKKRIAEELELGQKVFEADKELSRVEKAITTVADDFIWQEKMQKEIEKTKGTLPDDMNPYMQRDISIGRVADTINRVYQKIFGKTYGEMATNKKGTEGMAQRMDKDKLNITDLDFFNYVQHAKEYNKRVMVKRQMEKDAEVKMYEDRLADLATQDQNNPSVKAQTTKATKALAAAQEIEIPDAGSGMTDAEADNFMKEFEKAGKKDKLEAYSKEFRETVIQKAIDLREEAGEFSKKQAKALREGKDAETGVDFEFYVPLKVKKEALKERVGDGGTRGAALEPLQRIKGTNKYDYTKRISPITQSLLDFQAAVKLAEDNKVAQSLYNLVKENPNSAVWEIIDVATDADGNIVETIPQEIKDNSKKVKIGGKIKYIKFNHQGLRDAWLKAGSKQNDLVKLFYRLSNLYNTYKRAMVTQLSIEFAVTNAPKDLQDVIFNASGIGVKGFTRAVIKNYRKGMQGSFKAIMGNLDPNSKMGKTIDEFLSGGGKISWMNYGEIENEQKRIQGLVAKYGDKGAVYYSKAAMKNTIATLSAINESVEMGTRLAVFMAAREYGISVDQAASLAKNLSVNFNKKGTSTTTLQALWLFSNVGFQSLYRGIKTLGTDRGKKRAAMVFGLGIAFAFAQKTLVELLSADDEEEDFYMDMITAPENANHFILPLGDKRYFRVPKSFGMMRVMFNGGYELGSMYIDGDTEEHAANMASTIWSTIDPITGNSSNTYSALFPTALRPFAEVNILNRDYKQSPILPDLYGAKQPDYLTYYERTNDLYKNIAKNMYWKSGETIDVSPETLEYIVSDATGGIISTGFKFYELSDALFKGAEVDKNKIPFYSKFMVDMKQQEYRYSKDFYEIYEDRGTKVINQIKLDNAYKYAKQGNAVRSSRNEPPLVKDLEKKMREIKKAQAEVKLQKEQREDYKKPKERK